MRTVKFVESNDISVDTNNDRQLADNIRQTVDIFNSLMKEADKEKISVRFTLVPSSLSSFNCSLKISHINKHL